MAFYSNFSRTHLVSLESLVCQMGCKINLVGYSTVFKFFFFKEIKFDTDTRGLMKIFPNDLGLNFGFTPLEGKISTC